MSKFYCPRIIHGIAFTPNRDYDVCGVRDLNSSSNLGIASSTYQDFLSSTYRQNLLKEASTGKWPKGCESCFWLETIGLKSPRLGEIEYEKQNGARPLVHINSGSICDSDCIMCGPRWSTTIANRLKQFPDPTQTYFTLGNEGFDLPTDDKSLDNMRQAIKAAKRIKVVGGEPFIDKKLWKFLSQVADKDVTLTISTNGNSFPTKNQLTIFKKFLNIEIIFSIDGTDLYFEWIRQNLSYKTLINNYLKIKTSGIASYAVTCVAQAHNLLNLNKLNQVFKNNITFNPLTHPSLLAARNAPKWVLEKAIDENKDSKELQTILNLSLTAGPTHDLMLLKSHTDYLNSHRTHYFDHNTWTVQKKS